MQENNEADIELGGKIPLIDALDDLHRFFSDDVVTRNAIFERLMPRGQTKGDFSLLVICWRMAKLGKRPQDIFKMFSNVEGSVQTD